MLGALLLPFMAAVVVGSLAMLTYLLLNPSSARIARRARRLGEEGRDKRLPSGVPSLRVSAPKRLDLVVHRLLPQPDQLRIRLSRTGTNLTMGNYVLIGVGLMVVTPILLLLRGTPIPIALLTGILTGLALPHLVVGFMIGRRRGRFIKLFADAIALMVRGLKAGLPVTETMAVVGREVRDPVGEEFRRIVDQVRLGQQPEDVMWGTAKRLDIPEFNFLVVTLSIQRETGGNLAETLENLEDILRKREQMLLKIKAMSSEAVASAVILGSMPFIMTGLLYLVSASYITILFTTDIGLYLLAGGGFSLLVGIAIMARMVNFEI
jgi:tight adherence protein B